MTESTAADQATTGFAETAWDRESTCWRVRVGGEPTRGQQGQALAFGSFNEAYDAAQRVNGRRTAPPPACPECNRLREQARAALPTGDQSRLADLRVLQARHYADAHPAPAHARA
ncbi:hypothetical protein ABUW04_02585 [Streptacidiphilus sp. N1-10]|uniref:Uncharacterized protein n=1 Tax=Streptacidiphilus jeojiensis TaxID=3229225 RepID=A0ABV6XFV5_9ACTN